MQNTDVKVFVRIKPESSGSVVEFNQSKVSVTCNVCKSQDIRKEEYLSTYSLSCHGVIAANRSTIQACQDISLEKNYIEECLREKKSALICCYGQSGSGKTFTMFGTRQHPGLLEVAMEYLLSKGHQVSLGSFEVYNDKMIDLIPVGSSKGNRKPIINLDHFRNVLQHIQIQRSSGSTGLNQSSSRSHGLIRIYIEPFDSGILGDQDSSITLIDLAGSERCMKSKTSGQGMQEGIQINKSLMTLRACIRSIASNDGEKKQYVPWRESRLTTAMRPYLHKGSNVCFILCIASDASNANDSVSALQFGATLMNVTLEEDAVRITCPPKDACLCREELSPCRDELHNCHVAHASSHEHGYHMVLVISLGILSILLFVLYAMYWVTIDPLAPLHLHGDLRSGQTCK